MKYIKSKFLIGSILGTILISLLYSCSSDDSASSNGSDLTVGGVYKYVYARPTASSPIDYSAPVDSLTTVGFSGVSYLVRGTGLSTLKKVTVNGTDVYFNSTLVTDTQFFINLPTGIPYSDDTTPNKLEVVTKFGTTSTYFYIGQPYPTIKTYPLALIGGETITITGTDFARLQAVKFGKIENGVDTTVEGEILSSDEKSITVKVPTGVPSTGNIFVKTFGGMSAAAVVYGSDYPVFEESELFDDWSWAAIHEPSNEQVRDGVYSEKLGYTGWDALYAHLLTPVKLGDYKYLKISLYSAVNTKVKIFCDWSAAGKVIDIAEGKWNDLLIPVSDLTTNLDASTQDFIIQESTGGANTVYVDSMGFIK